jgi:tetratricopeptide (TPR) repeat protein
LSVLAASGRAQAADIRNDRSRIESDLVKQGITAYNELEYARAIGLLQQALRETLTREEKLATFQTLGFAHVALEQREAALADFANLLRVAPSFELDRTISPRVRVVFEEARSRMAVGGGSVQDPALAGLPTLEPQASWGGGARPREGRAVDVRVALAGGAAARGELYFRARGQSLYNKLTALVDAGGGFAVTVPGMNVRAPGLEYYVVLLDAAGVSVARAGSLGQPLGLDVDAGKTAVYKRGWFWGVIVGAAVVGAGVATAVALTARPSVSSSTPATIVIQPMLTIGR